MYDLEWMQHLCERTLHNAVINIATATLVFTYRHCCVELKAFWVILYAWVLGDDVHFGRTLVRRLPMEALWPAAVVTPWPATGFVAVLTRGGAQDLLMA
ncbi:hypothetical protein PR202_ga31354 [Eleusine coracana subsp. coracana]|uniref:Uncharacterized protein n=1 Tax=Eleusine coracana subsp. coracana TaxID=191504 RepID=A0AAV5DRM4_ELECO|nr:hypothetical protein PR202_ga31354 [Eleusine coracana subsp. coracana]